MKKIILSIAVVFIFAALLPNTQQMGIRNPYYAYFLYAVQFINQNYFIFILGFVVLTVILIRLMHFDKSYPRHKHYSNAAFQIVNAFIIGIFVSYLFLLSMAFIELNVLSISIHINKNSLGLITNEDTIVNILKKDSFPPQLIASDKGQNKEVVAIARSLSGDDNFYGNYILSSIPTFLIFPVTFDSNFILIDNTLIITQLNEHDMQKIIPTLSYKLIQKYFPFRRIKSFPQISIMSDKEYQVHRQSDYKENLVKINQDIKKYESLKSSTSLSLNESKTQLQNNKNKLDSSTALKNSEYKQCLSDGSRTLASCKNLLNGWTDLTLVSQQINDLNKKIASDESNLKVYEKYSTFYTTLGQTLKILTKNSPHELGLFIPKDSIRIVFSPTDSHKVVIYLETLAHEYLHYASYISEGKKFSDTIFEEGLTEYFARKVIKDDLNVDTNIGYPVFVKIITQMTKRVLDSDLEEIYFTKDQAKLEATLDGVYGENFYKNSRLLFLTLQYTSDQKQAIKVGNEIMKKIGGSPLNAKDVYSSSNEL